MRFTRRRVRIVLVAMASAVTGYAAAPSYIAYMNAYPHTPSPEDPPGLVLVTAAVIGVATLIAILGILALLPRMTTRRWMVAIAIVATLLAIGVHLSHVADKYRAMAKHHELHASAVSFGKRWSGSLDEQTWISVGTGFDDAEELKGRELALFLWHEKLSQKYRIAAGCPWFPVPPDPPEPD
jgi:hypothetical protein